MKSLNIDMKKNILLTVLFLLGLKLSAQHSQLTNVSQSRLHSELSFKIGEISYSTNSDLNGTYTNIEADGLTKSYDVSNPDLPVYSKLIELPKEGGFSIDIVEAVYDTLDLALMGYHHEVNPAQPSLFKKQDRLKVEFEYNNVVYSKDEYYSQDKIRVERLGSMRNRNIARLQIAPFAYNPLSNHLIILRDVQFRVSFDNAISGSSKAYNSIDFEANFSKLVNANVAVQKNDFSANPIRMIVLSDPMFEDELQAYIQWKRRKGFEVIEAYRGADEVGYTIEEMKAYIQSFYDNASDDQPAPTYLLIVGDHEQIPSFDAGGHVSDMYYVEFDGEGDYFPEMFVGRFSANNLQELIPQLVKTMEYEKYEMPDPSYLEEALLVAGVDSYWAETHGNGQINYGTDYYFNDEHGLTTYTYLYPFTETAEAEASILADLNNGVGFGNYTAHCGPSGWGDPSFDIFDVETLENESEYGLLIGNCCQSNLFNGTTCLGEALLRGQKKGSIGYIGGSNNTLWDEDYYWGVGNGPVSANPTYEETSHAAYDCSFHENGEDEADWSITQGQILQAGNWAVTESASNNTQYYWEIYHLMGDPSVLTYYGVPSILTVNHPDALIIGSTSITVSTEEYTYVAVNQNGVLLDASYTNENGEVVLNFDPITSVDELEIVASKQNKQVYIAPVSVMPANSPFVSATDLVVEGVQEQGETINVGVNLQNLGTVTAEGLDIVMTSSNDAVIINNSQMYIDSVSGSSINQIDNYTTIDLIGPFEDQEVISLSVLITDDNDNQWNSTLLLIVDAPDLEFVSHIVEDEDASGIIDFGESANLLLSLENIGHASTEIGSVSFSSDFEFITFLEETVDFAAIADGAAIDIVVPISLSEDAPAGEVYSVYATALSEDGVQAEYELVLQTSNCLVGAMEVVLELNTDHYPGEISWTLADANGEVIDEVEGDDLTANQTYTSIYCFGQNEYFTFEIIDSYGDGINGEGYSIVVCGEEVVTGGDYGDGEIVNFISSCDQSLVVGCTDPEAENYDENAVVDDGTCGIIVYGCTDPTAFNYNSEANTDDGSCVPVIYGCTDSTALNYNSEANTDDGSCIELNIAEYSSTFKMYPNPTRSVVYINSNDVVLKEIKIHSITGQEVYSIIPTSSKVQLNVEELEQGIYLVKCIGSSGYSSTKPLIIR